MPKEDNRTQILLKALELFSNRGYDAVGIQELVKSVGVSKPTLYHYFGSKKGLLEILIKEKFEPFINQLALLADYKGDLPQTLRKITEHYFNFALSEKNFCRLHLSLSFPIPENEAYLVMKPWILAQQRLLEEMFMRASSDHGNMLHRQHHFANSFIFFLNGQLSLIYVENLKVDDHLIWSSVQQFSHGIYS